MLNHTINNLIPKHETLIVSVSGGIDSMALLHLLIKKNSDIIVVHFNHQKRASSNDEAIFIADFCHTNHLTLETISLEIKGGNFHQKAHDLRNQHLKDVARKHNATHILTAHHLDDLSETILLHLVRGSNLLGYAGMQQSYTKSGFTYLKPLLYHTKDELLHYVINNQVPYVTDESNASDDYFRNRLRHHVLPFLKNENTNLNQQIINYSMQMTRAFKMIRKQSLSLLSPDLSFALSTYHTSDEALQYDLIALLLESYDLSLSYQKIDSIHQLLAKNEPKQMHLSSTYILIKSYQSVFIKPINKANSFRAPVTLGENILPNMNIFTLFDNEALAFHDSFHLCYNKLSLPLWVRYRKPGDLLTYPYGHKKLKKLFIDQKVPEYKRDHLLILTDNNDQILWVEQVYINQTLGKDHQLFIHYKGEK